MWVLRRDELATLRRGAELLGSGGAGDTAVGVLLVDQGWTDPPQITVLDAEDLPDDATVISAGLVGSVTAFAEKPPAGTEFSTACRRLIEHLDPAGPVFVATYEAAGLNAVLSLLIAFQLGVPLVDVDGMGRGLSWVDQTTYDVAGVSICPLVLTSTHGHTFIIEDTSGGEVERYVRSLTVQMGGWCAFAGYPLTRQDCLDVAIRGSLRRCLDVGRASLRHAGGSVDGPMPWDHLAHGRVVDVRWTYPSGYPRGTITVLTGDGDRRPIRIEASNEFLMVVDEGRSVAQAPTIISLVNRSTGAPVLAERIVVGIEVDIVSLRAPHRWQEPLFADRADVARFGLGPRS